MFSSTVIMTLAVPILRHLIAIAAGILVAKGYVDQSSADNLSGSVISILTNFNLESLSGVVLAVVNLAWWFFTKPSTKALGTARTVDATIPSGAAVEVKPAGANGRGVVVKTDGSTR